MGLRSLNKQIRGRGAFLAILIIAISLSSCRSLPEPSEEVRRQAQIEQFFQKWQGTQYGYGGTGQSGIDCSALMVEAYSDIYSINLPRTTEHQAKLGKRIKLKKLQAGDLVFFKTGFTRRHVGIYLDDGIFVHASESGGVMKSSLESVYWSDHYWKARRIKGY
jgi:probable lipoprotein NlpC